MESNVFTSNESDISVSKWLGNNETMETPFKGIPETILEMSNEDGPSPNASMEVNEDFYSPFKDSMEGKTNETGNFKSVNENETFYKDGFVQTDRRILADKESQTDNLGLRRKLNLQHVSQDSISTPPSELRKQIFDLRDELNEAHEFHDAELQVMQEELKVDGELEKDVAVEDLKKSLVDAEIIYLDACKQISHLKTENLELIKKMEDESSNWLSCKLELEGQISKLTMDVKRKVYEIENLKKDKDDFDFRFQLQIEKSEKRILDLEAALGDARSTGPSKPELTSSSTNFAVNELQEKITSLQSQLEESREKIHNLEQINKDIEVQKDIFKRKEELIAYNENQINSILQKNEELSSDIKKCKEESQKSKSNYEKIIKSLKEEWNNEVVVLKSEKDSLNDIIQQLSRENNELNEALKKNKYDFDLKNEILIGDLATELDDFKGKYESLAKEKDELNVLIQRLSRENNEINEALSKIKCDLDLRNEEIISLSDFKIKCETLVNEKDGLYEELNEFKSKYEQELEKIKLQNELQMVKVEKEDVSMNVEAPTIIKTENFDETVTESVFEPKFDFENFVKEFSELLVSKEIVSLEEIESSGNVFYLLVDKYLEVLEKFEGVQTEQEYKIKMECLENLCSQLEASDSTLNASNNSFASFATDIKSSMMMHEASEIETTILNDRTLMNNDPLAFTPFKTPKSILKSPKSILKSTRRAPPKVKLFNENEEILEEKFKLLEKMESRIDQLEDLASMFEGENDKLREKFLKEMERLKNSLATKSSEVDDIRTKLICEIMSLKPELENNLASTSTEKILKLFIETIMEKCRIVEEDLTEKFNKEKFEWEDKKMHLTTLIDGLNEEKKILTDEIELSECKINKLTEELTLLKEGSNALAEKKLDIEERLTNQNEELRLLYSRLKEFQAMENNLSSANEIITSLRNEVLGAETLKSEITDLRMKIQEKDSNLTNEISEKEKIFKDFENSRSIYDKISSENETLKQRICESEKMIGHLEQGIALAKEGQASNELRVQELMNEVEMLKKELSEGDLKNKALEEEIEDKKLENENLNLKIQDLCKLEGLNDVLSAAECKNKELQLIADENGNKLKLAEEENEKKSKALEDLVKNCKHLEGQLKSEISHVEELNVLLENAESKNQELQKSLENLELKMKELEELKRLRNTETEDLQNLLLEAQKNLSTAKIESENLQKFLNEKTEELEDLKRSKNVEIENLKNSWEDAQKTDETKIQELEKFLNEKTAELEEKNLEFENLKNSWEAKLKTAEENLTKAEENAAVKNQELQKFLDVKTEELEEMSRVKNSEIENLKNKLESNLEDVQKNLNSELETAKSKNQELLTFLNEKTEEFEELKRQKNLEIENWESKLKTAEENLLKAEESVAVKNEELQKFLNAKSEELEEMSRVKNLEIEELKRQKTLEIENLTNIWESKLKTAEEHLLKAEENVAVKTEEFEEFNRLKNLEIENLTNNWESKLKIAEETLTKAAAVKNEELQKFLDVKTEELEEVTRVKNLEIEDLKRKLQEKLEDAQKTLNSELENVHLKNKELMKCLEEKLDELEETRRSKTSEIENFKIELKSNLEELEETKRSKDSEIENLKIALETKSEKFLELEENNSALTSQLEEAEKRLKIQIEQTEDLKKMKEDLRYSEEKVSKLSIKIEELTCDNSQKIVKTIELEKCIEKFRNEQNELNDKLKQVEGREKNLEEILSGIRTSLDLQGEDFKNPKIVADKINEFKKMSEEIQGLFSLVSESEKRSNNVQDSCKSITDEINNLRSIAISLQDEFKRSEKKKSEAAAFTRKIGKLEELNTHLTEIINEIVNVVKLPEPEKLNLRSVRSLNSTKKQILDHFSNLIIHDPENCPKFSKIVDDLRLENSKFTKLTKEQSDEINKLKTEISTLQTEFLTGNNNGLPKKTGRKSDLCNRRLDKLEELNQIFSDLMTEIIAVAKVPNTDRLNLFSARSLTAAKKQVLDAITNLSQGKTKEMEELKEQNKELDDECESYSKEIKTLQQKIRTMEKEAIAVREALETEIVRLKDEKHALQIERGKLVAEMEELKDGVVQGGSSPSCKCPILQRQLTEVKRTLYSKEQKILELEDLEVAISSSKSQIKYLEKALDDTKRKCVEEEERNKQLQAELRMSQSNDKTSKKSSGDHELLEELRMRGTTSGGVVHEIVEKEKNRKLAKDNLILKELCRTRNAEIKRLEAEINALKNTVPKNTNQMDSPIRTRCYNTRSRKLPDDPKSPWRFFKDKENQNLQN